MTKLNTFLKDDSGATMVEYGIMVALIAVVSIAVITTLGTSIRDMFTAVDAAI